MCRHQETLHACDCEPKSTFRRCDRQLHAEAKDKTLLFKPLECPNYKREADILEPFECPGCMVYVAAIHQSFDPAPPRPYVIRRVSLVRERTEADASQEPHGLYPWQEPHEVDRSEAKRAATFAGKKGEGFDRAEEARRAATFMENKTAEENHSVHSEGSNTLSPLPKFFSSSQQTDPAKKPKKMGRRISDKVKSLMKKFGEK